MYHKLQQNPLSSDIAKSINIYDINIYDIKLVVFFYIILFSYPHKMEYWMPPLVLVKKSPHPHWPIFQHISTRICLKKPTKVNSNSPEKFWDFTELKYGHCGYCHHCHRAASFQRLSHCIPMISLIKSSLSKNKTSRNYLVGGFNPPSEKWWSSSVGMMTFPTEWKVIKKLFQTTNQLSMPVPITLKWPILDVKSHGPSICEDSCSWSWWGNMMNQQQSWRISGWNDEKTGVGYRPESKNGFRCSKWMFLWVEMERSQRLGYLTLAREPDSRGGLGAKNSRGQCPQVTMALFQ